MQGYPSRERAVFEEAVGLCSPAERTAFLERVCAGDSGLRERVVELLEAWEAAEGFLVDDTRGGQADDAGGSGPHTADTDDAWDESPGPGSSRHSGLPSALRGQPGDVIGRYRLVDRLGEGGFGIVYLAEQEEPVQRRVALKVLKPGMDTRQVVARFEQERQSLAMMDHPGIARVYDGGTVPHWGDRPFFVMELVEGIPITRYCDERRLGVRERLEIFAEVCGAVRHAHQKGVIHRDLKPSNVLVATQDGKPLPKVIDFGISKAAIPTEPDRSALTWAHQLLGTPAYMSPEQADGGGLDVDTRSDVYSLGVLLYELLAGRTPFDGNELLQVGLTEMRRLICEEDPPLPSARAARLDPAAARGTADNRSTTPERLVRQLRGDLDWIAARALVKDRSGRYQSVGELERDIRRHLTNEPVSAAAPSLTYRFGKFARRHRTAIVVAVPLAAMLALGIGVSAYFAVRAMRTDRALQGETAVTHALNRFLTEDVLAQADPDAQPERDIRLRTVLDRAALQVGERFRGQPLIEAAIRGTLAEAYENLGEYESALPHYRRAFELRFHELGESHRRTLEAMSRLALAHSLRNEHDRAMEMGSRVRDLARARLGDRDPFTVVSLCRLAQIAFSQRDLPLARRLSREALDLCREIEGVPVEEQVLALHVQARTVGREGAVDEGERHLRQAVNLARDGLGPDHPRTLATMSWLAAYLYDHERSLHEVERLCLDALGRARRSLGEGHLRTLILRNNLVLLYQYRMQDRLADALHHQFELLRFKRPPWPDSDVRRLRELLDLAPPGFVRDLAPLVPDRWLAATFSPTGDWTAPRYSTVRWEPLTDSPGTAPAVPAEGGELWLRQEFNLTDLPVSVPAVLVRSNGRWDVHVNGVPVPPPPAAEGPERLRVHFLDEAAQKALRPGNNVLALHGISLPPGEFVSVQFCEVPPAPSRPVPTPTADPE